MLVPIPALNDNYIWLYRRENFPVIVIDIPEIKPLVQYLESRKFGGYSEIRTCDPNIMSVVL